MPKAATETTAKTTRRTKASTPKEPAAPKAKRAPSAYNLFMAEHLKKWKADNPGSQIKDGMAAVAALWREAPENPKRGQEPAEKKTKAKVPKAPAKKVAKKKPAKEVSDEEDDEE